MNEAHKPESTEVEPQYKDITVFRVRHGETVYSEHTKGVEVASQEDPKDLTPQGEETAKSAAETIAGKIDPDRDLVVVISSPRLRAKGTAGIIYDELLNRFGEDVIKTVPDSRAVSDRQIQDRIQSVEMVDEEGAVVETADQRYPDLFNTFADILNEETQKEGRKESSGRLARTEEEIAVNGGSLPEDVAAFEPFSGVEERSRSQLAKLMRVARTIQPTIEKKYNRRLTIIQVEHNETLNELYSSASDGQVDIRRDTTANKGEVIELKLPVAKDSNKIDVSFLDDSRELPDTTIEFDPLSRQFTK